MQKEVAFSHSLIRTIQLAVSRELEAYCCKHDSHVNALFRRGIGVEGEFLAATNLERP